MEKVPQEKTHRKENSKEVLALVLIGIGLLWILKQTGFFFKFPFLNFHEIFSPITSVFHGVGHFVFSWPVILIIIGAVLMAGKRSGGLVLLIIGGLFLLPKLIFISGAAIVFLFPVILIALGIALIARLL
ncbi:LiaF transmembrane domain-containing protein [Draconibacterium halophilum]|uniref:LiaF transmembrane domain-containing protein n=1 Tax=Draconibacterium halophilum TaxID=2706887 RepID=A0A6C0RIW1_9BACT|nr:hypothetical protein [Draconibacterium halophilum]QIA09493.1 hypothetical protein G0Q07_18055 [Draconibacterium halophilum]